LSPIETAAFKWCANRDRERDILAKMRKCERAVYPSDIEWSEAEPEHGLCSDPYLTDDAYDRLGHDADDMVESYVESGCKFEPCSRKIVPEVGWGGYTEGRQTRPDEYCEPCQSNLPLVVELRKCRARRGGLTAALMGAWRRSSGE